MNCRMGCGACCIVPSISSSIPGMPDGKPANVKCIHLSENNLCELFEIPERPKVCSNFVPAEDVCGNSREEAMKLISLLEKQTVN